MKPSIVVLAIAFCAALVSSHPLPEGERLRSEALDRLLMVEADNETALRSKRTIGILRELFPEISQMIEQKVNSIVAEVIRVLGPTVLRNFLGNNQAGGSASSDDGSTATAASPFDEDEESEGGISSTSSNGSRVSISLPTFPPDEDEERVSTTIEPSSTSASTSGAGQITDRTTVGGPAVA